MEKQRTRDTENLQPSEIAVCIASDLFENVNDGSEEAEQIVCMLENVQQAMSKFIDKKL